MRRVGSAAFLHATRSSDSGKSCPCAYVEGADEVLLEIEEPADYAELRSLLAQRDSIVKAHLDSLFGEEKKKFAKLELEVNNTLKNVVQSLLETSKEDIIQFVRSKAAVKKYK